ncbi:hypothetical protein PYW07_007121 [Mythimna separata]|uniref:Complex I-9kD n=1 Tax=Mythimna separata TaxID=271217 RepID=A0AAD7Z2F2_MYTSE|nr:hypothetical protein PYW07_007121 [Mythimna separata]
MARTVTPTHTHTVFNKLSSFNNLLRLYSITPPCAGDYDSRKISHELPTSDPKPEFKTLKNIPPGVFRNTQGEILGLGAGKKMCYKNPEYFSFHNNSFYDFNISLRQYRQPCPKSGRKRN